MSLHDQALRTVIRMEGHADVYSFPEMWLRVDWKDALEQFRADLALFNIDEGTT